MSAENLYRFSAGAIELQNVADYQQESAVSLTEAERAIEEASQLVETIATLIESL
jgi:hypothetical protein